MRLPIAALLATVAAPALAQTPEMALWRLDCGTIAVPDMNEFSDSYAFSGRSFTMANSCYLIRHGDDYLMWDAGLPLGLPPADPSAPAQPTSGPALTAQLAQIGVTPEQVDILALSHSHFDHMGQAADFAGAKLLIGAADWAGLQASPPPFGVEPALGKPWLDGAEVEAVTGDHDVFGDHSLTMLAMPGHTPGQNALLIRLPQTGTVLLSADVVHFAAQLPIDGVPAFNADRAQSVASIERLKQVAANTGARLIINHDPASIPLLPAFPEAAR